MIRSISLTLVLLLTAPAAAQQRLSADASPQRQVRADLEWAVPMSRVDTVSDKAFTQMLARVSQLDIRLDTRRFQGRRARIYMSVPLPVQGLSGAGGLRLRWQTEGVFQDGTLVPGERSLIYSGPITEAELRDRLDLTVEVDAQAVSHREIRFEPVFLVESP